MGAPGVPCREQSIHVAILGAGVGGLALAIGLLRQGIKFTLYESAAAFSTVGAGVGLGPNALRAMEMLQPGFLQQYAAISSGNVTPGKDHVMMDAMLSEQGLGIRQGLKPLSWGAECYERTSAHRKDLLDIMTSWIQPADCVRFNKRATSIAQSDGGSVLITFEDGETAEADCVVGADGVRGISRGFVLRDRWTEFVDATYTGRYVYRAVVPMEEAMAILGKDDDGHEIAGDAKMFMGEKCVVTLFPISQGTQSNLVCFRFDDSPWTYPDWKKPVSKEEMKRDIAELGVDERLVRLLDWAKPVQWALHDHLDTPTYYNARICLLGDSAHATLPHQAAGAGQCIEDALILCRLLALVERPGQIEAAFKVYDAIRRPRAQRIVETSREAGELVSFKTPGVGADLDKIVANQQTRYLWIWEHDLEGDLARAEAEFASVLGEGSAEA